MNLGVRQIISGGQTGADRAALDFAIENGFETGGWIPQNRCAEDGRISDKYVNLRETETDNLAVRTELNVRDSDATVIISHGILRGGSEYTLQTAEEQNKPCLHIDLLKLEVSQAAAKARDWLIETDCKVLNVAGARLSEDVLIYDKTKQLLSLIFDKNL